MRTSFLHKPSGKYYDFVQDDDVNVVIAQQNGSSSFFVDREIFSRDFEQRNAPSIKSTSSRRVWFTSCFVPIVSLAFFGWQFAKMRDDIFEQLLPTMLAIYGVGIGWLLRSIVGLLRSSNVKLMGSEAHEFETAIGNHWFTRYTLVLSFLLICILGIDYINLLHPSPTSRFLLVALFVIFLMSASNEAKEIPLVISSSASGGILVFGGITSAPVGVAIALVIYWIVNSSRKLPAIKPFPTKCT